MRPLIAFIIALAVLASIQLDIDKHIEAASDPVNTHGTADLQKVVEQSLIRFDALNVDPCFREWWALERSALFLLGEAMRYHVMGDTDKASAVIDAVGVLRFYGAKGDTTCVQR